MIVSTGRCSFTTTTLTSSAVELHSGIAGNLFLPAAYTGSKVTFLGSVTRDGTFAAIRDEAGTLSSIVVVTGSWHEMPSELFSMHSVKVVADTSQTAANNAVLSMRREP